MYSRYCSRFPEPTWLSQFNLGVEHHSPSSLIRGLSNDAGIGIGVGIGIGGLALAGFCVLFFIQQRRKWALIKKALHTNGIGKAELDSSGGALKVEPNGSIGGVTTAEEKRTHELESPLTIQEINSESYPPPQELQASIPVAQESD